MKKKESFLIFKVTSYFLLVLLLFSLLLISGCTPFSNLLFGPSGSIEVTTYPSGAKIFLNDKDIEHLTPYTITNLARGTYEVKVTLDDISYTETVMVYSNHTTSVYKDLVPRLNKIIVQPSSMNLKEGEHQKINSITAYYINSGSADIALSDCSYSSSSNHATVNSSGTITGVSEGSATINVSYTEEGITKTDTVYVTINPLKVVAITRIDVLPSSMNLDIGESETISSITAHYDDASSEGVALSDCSYSSSDSGCATVDSNGTITGVSDSLAIITVSYTKDEITKTDTIEVIVGDIAYRALCVGVGDYLNDDGVNLIDLLGPPYDVDRMIDVFSHCKFGTDEVLFSTSVSLIDLNATKTNIINGITSTFSGADDNDISYFYFSGHGSYTGTFTTSYILPTDVELSGSIDSMISVDELESALSAIPGRKVVILDSCFSGGFVGKGEGEDGFNKDNLGNFNNNIINTFLMGQSRGLLTTNQYKVLTSCHYNEPCLEYPAHPLDGDPFGLFTAALCEGCGYNTYSHPYPADDDENNKVSLQESYLFIVDFVNLYFSGIQDVQVHPYNSDFTIVEHSN
jgi:hypothetical protein